MTDQQPLTRRQARALEREQEQATASLPIISPVGTPVVTSLATAPTVAAPVVETESEPSEAPVSAAGVEPVVSSADEDESSDAASPVETPARVDPFAAFGAQALPEHTLTRRELRALLYQPAPQGVESAAEATDSVSDLPSAEAPVQSDASFAARSDTEAGANAETTSSAASEDAFAALMGVPAEVAAEASTFAPAATATDAAHPLPSATTEPELTGAHGASAHPDDLDDEVDVSSEALPAPVSAASQTGTAGIPMVPTGHWTEQLDAPAHDAIPFDDLISTSSIGVGTTSNALILPTLPATPSMAGNVSPDLVVTGTLQVSRGSAGSRTDGRALDQLLEHVEDLADTGVAPVAASKAVGTATKTVAAVKPPKRDRASVPLVLGMVAGVLALAVVAVVIVGNTMNLF